MTSLRGISQLVSEAEKVLGPNTVFVITPDNGGSVWSEIVIPENLPTFLEPFPKLSGSEGWMLHSGLASWLRLRAGLVQFSTSNVVTTILRLNGNIVIEED